MPEKLVSTTPEDAVGRNATDRNVNIVFIYVSPEGDDKKGDGGMEAPYQTLHKAKERVRELIKAGMTADIEVLLRGGRYYLEASVTFDEQDSGNNGFKVLYKNYPGEEPILIGGRRITGWTQDAGNIYKIKIPEVKEGIGYIDQIFENGKRGRVARYPNEGYLTTEGSSEGANGWNEDAMTQFTYQDGDLPSWDLSGAQVNIWHAEYYGNDTLNIKSLDTATRTITLTERATGPLRKNRRYYIQRVKEALDSPGEFYYDRDTGILYYWPYSESVEDQEIIVPVVDNILVFKALSREKRVQHIHFEGIHFLATNFSETYKEGEDGWERPGSKAYKGAIYTENASNISIRCCKIHGAGYQGIHLGFYSQNITLYGNEIYDCGYNGIQLIGMKWGALEEGQQIYDNKNNLISNNYIHHCGTLIRHGSGVYLNQSGENEISYNIIKHIPRYGIGVKGTRMGFQKGSPEKFGEVQVTWENHWDFLTSRHNIIKFNDISYTIEDSSDVGAITMWSSGRGNVIYSNRLHHMGRTWGKTYALYMDDACDDCMVKNNVIYGVMAEEIAAAPVMAKGIGQTITNNILINEKAISMGVRATYMSNGRIFGHKYLNNIIYNKEEGSPLYYLNNFSIGQSPTLTWLEYCDYNLYYQASGVLSMHVSPEITTLDHWKEKTPFDRNSIVADPKFVDVEGQDFRLDPASPAYALGFRDIDMASIGVKEDFPYKPDEPLDKLYLKVEQEYSSLRMSVEAAKTLELRGRTASGFPVDLRGVPIKYIVDNPDVATISPEGKVLAVRTGMATITATASHQGVLKQAHIQVVVKVGQNNINQ